MAGARRERVRQLDLYPATGYVVVILTNTDQAMIPAIQRSEAILTDR